MPATLFDFFGTLVDYAADRTQLRYPRAHAVLGAAGLELGHDEWLAVWDDTGMRLDIEADDTGVEFSMTTYFAAYAAAIGHDPDEASATAFLDAYVDEWCAPVRLFDGVPALLNGLRERGHRLAVVSNTHDGDMVRRLLDSFGIADAFDVVVTSIDLGLRKPQPAIYQAALDAIGVPPADAVFVGDSYVPDFVGPRSLGMDAFLIVGAGEVPEDVPAARRLVSVTDLAASLPTDPPAS